jgi:hypothetical protein
MPIREVLKMIAIPMKKPKNCIECKFTSPPEGECWFVHDPNDCPLIEIVTCGECKHYAFGLCSKLHLIVSDDDFCSDGERRE